MPRTRSCTTNWAPCSSSRCAPGYGWIKTNERLTHPTCQPNIQGRYEEAAECFKLVLDLCQAFATQVREGAVSRRSPRFH